MVRSFLFDTPYPCVHPIKILIFFPLNPLHLWPCCKRTGCGSRACVGNKTDIPHKVSSQAQQLKPPLENQPSCCLPSKLTGLMEISMDKTQWLSSQLHLFPSTGSTCPSSCSLSLGLQLRREEVAQESELQSNCITAYIQPHQFNMLPSDP